MGRMSDVIVDNCSDNSSDSLLDSEEIGEKYPKGVAGLKELREFLLKREQENLKKDIFERKKFGNLSKELICEDEFLTELSTISSTPEKDKKTPKKLLKRKRKKSEDYSASNEESEDDFGSPEIPVAGSPVIYHLCQQGNKTIILKKRMETKRELRPKKCTINDITTLLNSDEDESIFDSESTKKKSTNPPGTPKHHQQNISKISNTPIHRRSPRVSRATSNLKFQSETPIKEEGSLRMKIRRSTDQSNYKVESLDVKERRASLRTTIFHPNRYHEDDELEKSKKKLEFEVLSLSKRQTKKITNKNDGEKSPKSSKTLEDEVLTPIKTRSSRKINSKSTRLSILKSVSTIPNDRPRRCTRLTSYDHNYNESIEEVNENNTNNANKSDESDVDEKYNEKKLRQISQLKIATPQKSPKINDPNTPKRQIQKMDLDDISTPKRTPRSTRNNLEKMYNPSTPKNRGKSTKSMTPSIRNNLTPSMRQRTANIGKPKTILQEARAQLHVSAVPKSLPCRESEFNDIFTFLQRKLVDETSGCIYISGVPGTGKTATVNEVIRCLKKLESNGELKNFDFLTINGMKLTEPRQVYTQILKQLTGENMTWEQAYQTLEKRFTKLPKNREKKLTKMTLLLVDELDLLCNKRQDVVYNLLDWPAKQAAQLVVITIANTMDLPERVLMGRVTSRLGLTRLTFQPYNYKQLQEIVTTRLKDSDAFRSEAIQLVARKVAAVSGDARRALDICRRATEIAENHEGKIVSMQDVNEALTEMIASAKVQAIRRCSEMEKVFLQAVCAEIQRTGVEETNFMSVYKQFEALCSFDGWWIYSFYT